MSDQVAKQEKDRNIVAIITWGVIGVVLLVFILRNSQDVEIDLAFSQVAMPLWLLVMIIFGLGLLAGWMTKWWTGRK